MANREPVIIAAVVAAVWVILLRRERVPQHTSILTGQLYYNEIIEHNNVAYFRTIARMEKESFLLLLDLLEREGGLKRSLKICAGQKLMIFIHILVGHSNRQTAGRWQQELQGPFRNRKEKLTQNVLAVADFDLTFAYALCGWEGSAHGQRVDNDAKGKGKPMFPGKYYLGDAGYTL